MRHGSSALGDVNPLLTAPYPAVPKDPPATAVTPHTPPTTPGNSNTSVEIVKGSEVFCSKQVWSAAINAKTATSMVRTLLIGVFPMEIILKSNLKGGKSKRDVDGPVRDALEPAIINAVFEATMKRHPHPLVTQGNKIQWRADELPFIFNDSRQPETITFKRRRLDDVSPGGQGKNRNASYFMQILGDRFRQF